MKSFGEHIKELRKAKGLTLMKVASSMGMDQAILSKIERGLRKANKKQVEKFSDYFNADKKELMVVWLKDKILYELSDEEMAEEALMAAEEQISYRKFLKNDRSALKRKLKSFFKKDGRINKAWIFGSFARGDDKPGSDIDIIVEEKKNIKFSYFDLADIQYKLEKILQRKIDIGFASALKEHAKANIEREAKLIYEDAR